MYLVWSCVSMYSRRGDTWSWVLVILCVCVYALGKLSSCWFLEGASNVIWSKLRHAGLINDLTGFQATQSLIHRVRGPALSALSESPTFPQLFIIDSSQNFWDLSKFHLSRSVACFCSGSARSSFWRAREVRKSMACAGPDLGTTFNLFQSSRLWM